jgi:hypothetical protein
MQMLVVLRKLQKKLKDLSNRSSPDTARLLRRINAIGPFAYLMLPIPKRAMQEVDDSQVMQWSRSCIAEHRIAQKVLTSWPPCLHVFLLCSFSLQLTNAWLGGTGYESNQCAHRPKNPWMM